MNWYAMLEQAFDPSGRPRDPAAIRALHDGIRGFARRIARGDDAEVADLTSHTLIKLRGWRSRLLHALGDAENRDARLAGWCREVVWKKFLSLRRKEQKRAKELPEAEGVDFERLVLPEPDEGPEPAERRAAFDALDRLTARAAAALKPRYREDFQRNVADLHEIAAGRSSVAALVARDGADPADRTAYDRVHKRLYRGARGYLLDQLERDGLDGTIGDDEHDLLARLLDRYLAVRSRRAEPHGAPASEDAP